jgi:ABC-2 type transport system permease protein
MSDATLAWRQYRLERKMFWRNPTAAFFSFVLPLIFLFLFGAVFSGSQANLNVLVPGIAGLSVMATTFNALATQMTFLREQGVLKRVRGTPLPGTSYLSGIIGSAATNAVIQILIIIVAGKLFFGLGWPKDWAELALFTVLGVACFASMGVAFSHVIPNFEAAPAYTNLVFLPMIFISGVFFDVDNVPTFLRDIANALPLVHVINGISAALVTGAPLADHLSDLAVVAVWTLACVILAARLGGLQEGARRRSVAADLSLSLPAGAPVVAQHSEDVYVEVALAVMMPLAQHTLARVADRLERAG